MGDNSGDIPGGNYWQGKSGAKHCRETTGRLSLLRDCDQIRMSHTSSLQNSFRKMESPVEVVLPAHLQKLVGEFVQILQRNFTGNVAEF